MSELPKCRLCGCKYQHVERFPELVHCCNPLCEMSLPRLKLTEWIALMGGGEPVAEACRRAPGGINWLCNLLPETGTKLYTHPAPAVDDAALYQSIAEALGEAMDCSRPWSAWDYDTLCRDDFHLLVEDSDRVNDIVDAVKAAMKGD